MRNSVLETNHFTTVTTVLGETTAQIGYLATCMRVDEKIIKQGLGWPDLHV